MTKSMKDICDLFNGPNLKTIYRRKFFIKPQYRSMGIHIVLNSCNVTCSDVNLLRVPKIALAAV